MCPDLPPHTINPRNFAARYGRARGLPLHAHQKSSAPIGSQADEAAGNGVSQQPSNLRAIESTLPAPAATPSVPTAVADAEFKAQLVTMIPHLRAFARSISPPAEAEDLAQDTMLRAWTARGSFQHGTNLKAWLFTILRNSSYSRGRRAWRTQPLDPEVAENMLVANDNPEANEDLVDLRNAMLELSFEHRQSLALVAAAGLSYAEAAVICGCAVGTVKSRVSRARAELTANLERRQVGQRAKTTVSSASAFESIMQESVDMQRGEPDPASQA